MTAKSKQFAFDVNVAITAKTPKHSAKIVGNPNASNLNEFLIWVLKSVGHAIVAYVGDANDEKADTIISQSLATTDSELTKYVGEATETQKGKKAFIYELIACTLLRINSISITQTFPRGAKISFIKNTNVFALDDADENKKLRILASAAFRSEIIAATTKKC